MKLITLNTWGGRAGKENLLKFFDNQKNTTDIFCLQEIWSAPYEHLEGSAAGGKNINHAEILVYGKQEISKTTPNHNYFFHPHHLENYGLLTLITKDLPIKNHGEIFVYKHKNYKPAGDIGNHARNIQYFTFHKENKTITVINFHGLWNGQGKGDSADRLSQSKKILDFIKTLDGEIIFCGDFNLSPNTESLKMFESFGLKNLIKEYNIQSTRTSFYTKPEKFADYIFVSNGIKVNDLKVLPEEVSDHAALFLDFD